MCSMCSCNETQTVFGVHLGINVFICALRLVIITVCVETGLLFGVSFKVQCSARRFIFQP